MTTLSLLAQSSGTQSGSPLGLLLPLLLMGAVFYFFLIRPQRAQRARQQQLLRSIDVGDEVITAGGMYGTIVEVDDDDDTVLVELAPGTRVKMIRRAISQRLTEDDDLYEEEDENDEGYDDAGDGPHGEGAEPRP